MSADSVYLYQSTFLRDSYGCHIHVSWLANTQNTNGWRTENAKIIQNQEVDRWKSGLVGKNADGVVGSSFFNNKTLWGAEYHQILDIPVWSKRSTILPECCFYAEWGLPDIFTSAPIFFWIKCFGIQGMGKSGPTGRQERWHELTVLDFFLILVKNRLYCTSLPLLMQARRWITAMKTVSQEILICVWIKLKSNGVLLLENGEIIHTINGIPLNLFRWETV